MQDTRKTDLAKALERFRQTIEKAKETAKKIEEERTKHSQTSS